MVPAPRVLGAIIAGGAARRFGSDKGAALFAGRALIDHAVATLAPLVDDVAIVGRKWVGLQSVPDRPGPGLGPMGGIAGSLGFARDMDYAGVLTMGCDTPVVPPALLKRLLAEDAAWCTDNPVIGFWPVRSAGEALAYAASDPKRSVRGWASSIGAVGIAWPGIANLNTPDDLARLEAR
ncbi:molybdenum cofactor guanylyltransferase [Sphingomonas sp. EC-HK361]|uniref:molybdenum cofactor guanylyltransferase n=1 Tax=Sphingomonas sp. EC-HK361 TaxID=2038397 RepID=UPI0018FE5676|nr:molybdenum cofactor guanylyltransferase [Sphingomonas sp. EC-HK361]